MRNKPILTIIATLSLGLSSAMAQSPKLACDEVRYRMSEVRLPQSNQFIASDVNRYGQVIGIASSPFLPYQYEIGIWRPSAPPSYFGMTHVSTIDAKPAIDSFGNSVYVQPSPVGPRASYRTAGSMSDQLLSNGSDASLVSDLNDRGYAVGCAFNYTAGANRATRFNIAAQSSVTLHHPQSFSGSCAVAISNTNQIAGNLRANDGRRDASHAAVWLTNGFYDLGPSANGGPTEATGIANGIVVGSMDGPAFGSSSSGESERPFYWSVVEGRRELALPQTFVRGRATAINSRGVIIGEASQSTFPGNSSTSAMIWPSRSATSAVSLNSLVTNLNQFDGTQLSNAIAISENGIILARDSHSSAGIYGRNFILTPECNTSTAAY